MSWKNNLQIYIDPSLKIHHKDLYQMIEKEFSKLGTKVFSDSHALTTVKIPIILFIDSSPAEELNEFLVNPENYVVQIEGANLSMFADVKKIDYSCYQLQDVSQVPMLLDDLLFMIRQNLKTTTDELIQNSEQTLKNLYSKKNISDILDSDLWNEVSHFEQQIYAYNTVEEVKEALNSESDLFVKFDLKLLSLADFLGGEALPHLPIQVNEEEYLFLTWRDEAALPMVMIVYAVLQESFSNQTLLYDSRVYKKRWEKILSLIPIPLVVFDDNGEVLIHNGEFAKLDLSFKQCQQFENKEQLTLKKSVFRILKRHLNQQFQEYLFFPVDDFLVESKTVSSEELGIISSSIAHEINNPLAGILAAIDYLLIDDIPEETKTELQDMKKGIARCQKLIKTFLGFSKVSNLPLVESQKCHIDECLNQSMDLIRFRLIENNLQMQFDHKVSSKYQYDMNPHVFSMLIYLILGDIVTNISHHSLVIRKTHNPIILNITEDSQSLQMKFPEQIQISSEILNSKLVNHLLDIVQMKANSESGRINLIRS